MRYFFSFCSCIISICSWGQSGFGADIAAALPKSKFYFVGQVHHNEANTIIERELLFALNARYHVQYDIIEFSHSAAFLVNQYLETGDEAFLKCIQPSANFNFVKTVKAYNDTLSHNRKIRFYGLDFEDRQDGKYLQKAFETILEAGMLPLAEKLTLLMQTIVQCQPENIGQNLTVLKSYVTENEQKCRTLLDKYYLDVVLMANAPFHFSSKRDAAMVSNFNLLYNELTRDGNNPSFFASFGIGHINPANNQGIAMQLMNGARSPVKNNVCILGIQYVNCLFGKENTPKPTVGNASFLCTPSGLEELTAFQNEDGKQIVFLPREKLTLANCNKAIQKLSGLIVVHHFGASSFWLWE